MLSRAPRTLNKEPCAWPATDRVKQILSWYGSDNPGREGQPRPHARPRAARRHGQARHPAGRPGLRARPGAHRSRRTRRPTTPTTTSSSPSTSGCNAYAAPLGFLEQARDKFAGQIPLILKLNNSDTLAKIDQPCSAVTGSVEDALRLGCAAIGYTIYPGSGERNTMYEDLRELILEAKRDGLPTVVVWAYPRGAGLSKDGETAVDVAAYAAQIAAQLGAHIIKIKPPKDLIEQAEAKKVFEKYGIPTKTLADRVRHCVQSAFNGKRILIFSGGETKGTPTLLEEVKGIAAGGAFGSIMGRNAFQRPKPEAMKLLHAVQNVFKGAP